MIRICSSEYRPRNADDQTRLSRSDFLARALRYYVEENPGGIPAFHSTGPEMGPLEQAVILPSEPDSDQTGIEEP